MQTIDRHELKRAGWRKRSPRTWSLQPRKGRFRLLMETRGKRVDEIVAENRDGQKDVIFDGHRGFRRREAKKLLQGRDYKVAEEILEALYQGYYITL